MSVLAFRACDLHGRALHGTSQCSGRLVRPPAPRGAHLLVADALDVLRSDIAVTVSAHHDDDIVDVREYTVLTAFPRSCRGQSATWWRAVLAAALRLSRALRTGKDVSPDTWAEVVCLHLATQPYYITAARLGDPDVSWSSAGTLTTQARDVLTSLVGYDTASPWDPRIDAVLNPDPTLVPFGLPDVCARSWFTPLRTARDTPVGAAPLAR